MLAVRIDPEAQDPPFAQLKTQIVEQVMSLSLPAGTRLPSVRTLAEQISVAPNTVAKAYRELEAMGYLETKGRLGTFVSSIAQVSEESMSAAKLKASQFVLDLRKLGLGNATIIQLVQQRL